MKKYKPEMKQYRFIIKNVNKANNDILETVVESFSNLLIKLGFLIASEYSNVDQEYLDKVMNGEKIIEKT